MAKKGMTTEPEERPFGEPPSAEKQAEPSESMTAPPSGNKPWYDLIDDADPTALSKAIAEEIRKIVENSNLSNYAILMLFDEPDEISNFHSDRLYSAATELAEKADDLLLILHTRGGDIEPAYLISKTLKRLARGKFAVTVPRRAKSAGTLIALGADEVHMGMISQLGPIDPQIGGLPVLGVANALETIADLTCRFPNAASMFAEYLDKAIPIRILGYYARVGESAVQYAERLLAGKTLAKDRTPNQVATHLVSHYKDHGFVIDYDEAASQLGDQFVRHNTPEYKLADEIYKFLDMVRFVLRLNDKEFWYVGKIDGGFSARQRRQ